MTMICQTHRLELRTFAPEDAAGFYQLNLDEEVIRYTGDQPFANPAEAAAFIAAYDHYQHYGYGRWSVYLHDEDRYVGFCGLKYSPDLDETDLGFRISRTHWGQGLATEAARAALELGFNHYNLERVVGRAMAENTASHRVLEKLGFLPNGDFESQDRQWRRFLLTRSEFTQSAR